MISALSVPCPWNCGETVDVVDEWVFDPNGCDLHRCAEGLAWRAQAHTDDLMLSRETQGRRLLRFLQSELRHAFHGEPEVEKHLKLIRKAVETIR